MPSMTGTEEEKKSDSAMPSDADGVSTEKAYPMLEVARHKTRRSAWLVKDGKVYDVTPYLDEHPGGDDILLDSAGRDATREFEDVGHSDSARAELAKFCIGVLRKPTDEELAAAPMELTEEKGSSLGTAIMKWALPLLLIVLAWAVRKYTK